MNLTGLTVITILGALLVTTGVVGLIYYIARYRRTRDSMNRNENDDPESAPNTFSGIFLANGFLHIGMLLLILGGASLIFFAQR